MSASALPPLSSPLREQEAVGLTRITGRIAVVRAAIALVWAAALAVAVGDDVPTTASDVTTAVAVLLSAYPLVDVGSSLVEASARTGRSANVLKINAAVSAVAAIGLTVATFAGDAGAALAVFGAWAIVSGVMQLSRALRQRRTGNRQWPMIVSGALSSVAGLTFVAASSRQDADLSVLAGYAAFGAVLYLVWAVRARRVGAR